VQSVVTFIVYYKLAPSVFSIHVMMLHGYSYFIVLLELKLQYSSMCYCIVCALQGKVDHAKLWDDTKLQLKQLKLG